jgi:hypothetical protein
MRHGDEDEEGVGRTDGAADDVGTTGGKLREIFGTGSLTSGNVTGGGPGAGVPEGDATSGGEGEEPNR